MSAIPQNLRFSPISIRTVKLYRQGPWDKYCEYLNTREICWDVAVASPSKVLCFFSFFVSTGGPVCSGFFTPIPEREFQRPSIPVFHLCSVNLGV